MGKKNKKLYIGLIILFVSLLTIVGTYSYWKWSSTVNKEVVFNTAKGLSEYIIYDAGEAKFVGDFKVSDNYTGGVHTTVSIHKTEDASDALLYASINMRVNKIGSNLSSTKGLKWVVTAGNSTNPGDVLAEGNFIGVNAKDEFMILPGVEVTLTKTEYTVWIWLDSNYATEDMSGEIIDTSIWTQVDQVVDNTFEITHLSNNYQVINATVVNSNKKIVSYAVTSDNVEPVKNTYEDVKPSSLVNNLSNENIQSIDNETQWITIPESERGRIFTLEYRVDSVGTYYVWFKDEEGNTISKDISVTEIESDIPTCIWNNFTPRIIRVGGTSEITLTCVSGRTIVGAGNITLNDITLSTDDVTLSDEIIKEKIEQGYKYTFGVTAETEIGSVTLTLKKDVINNDVGLGNISTTSSILTIADVYNITYKDIGDTEFSGVHEENYPEVYNKGLVTYLDIPTRFGYTFNGYYTTSDGSGDRVFKILATQGEDVTLYAKWIDDKPYGVANLSLNDGVFTLSLSNHGDDGSGLTRTYGYSLISSGSCEDATYEESSELSKTYNGSYTEGTTYYGCIKLADNAGNIAYLKSAGIVYNVSSNTWNNSGEHTFTVPTTGKYKLEVWGAQGGKYSTYVPGYGGYSVGTINLVKDAILYVNIGGQGGLAGSNSTFINGGYNGGGKANYSAGSGGGATHIATVSGLLSTLSSNKDKILIVAGGGGGTGVYNSNEIGGAGGGIQGGSGGNNSSTYPGGGGGGTQLLGGSLGSGSTAGTIGLFGSGGQGGYEASYSHGSGGGGGGYYGGAGGSARNGGGGGGSGYIGNSSLTDKYMYCYN